MRIIAIKTLREFWEQNDFPDSEQPLKAWYSEVKKAEWKSPDEIKAQYRNASILKNSRVVFNIAGNKYRIVVWINYAYGKVFIRFVGTHKQYDTIDASEV